jgi:hypothetical protein
VRPSDPTSEKSGAGSPGFKPISVSGARMKALIVPRATALSVATSRRSSNVPF